MNIARSMSAVGSKIRKKKFERERAQIERECAQIEREVHWFKLPVRGKQLGQARTLTASIKRREIRRLSSSGTGVANLMDARTVRTRAR